MIQTCAVVPTIDEMAVAPGTVARLADLDCLDGVIVVDDSPNGRTATAVEAAVDHDHVGTMSERPVPISVAPWLRDSEQPAPITSWSWMATGNIQSRKYRNSSPNSSVVPMSPLDPDTALVVRLSLIGKRTGRQSLNLRDTCHSWRCHWRDD